MLCTAEHCTLKSRKPKLCGDITETLDNSSYGKLLYFEQTYPVKNGQQIQQEIRANWINCLLYVKGSAQLTHFSAAEHKLFRAVSGTDLGGGCRGCAPPPEITCSFLIQLVFCEKKKNWFIGVEVKSKRRVHSLLKEILDPPLRVLVRFLEGSYIIVQVLKCKIPERVLFTERFSKVSRRWRCASCHPLQVLLLSRCQKTVIWQYYYFYYF